MPCHFISSDDLGLANKLLVDDTRKVCRGQRVNVVASNVVNVPRQKRISDERKSHGETSSSLLVHARVDPRYVEFVRVPSLGKRSTNDGKERSI